MSANSQAWYKLTTDQDKKTQTVLPVDFCILNRELVPKPPECDQTHLFLFVLFSQKEFQESGSIRQFFHTENILETAYWICPQPLWGLSAYSFEKKKAEAKVTGVTFEERRLLGTYI